MTNQSPSREAIPVATESRDVSRFAMLCCACGAEQAMKASIASQGWRLAFSRPGFVTVKHDNPQTLPESLFIRTACRSIGSHRSADASELIDALLRACEQSSMVPAPVDQLHVWPKDRAPIGRFGFEPGVDEVSKAVAGEIHHALGKAMVRCDQPNQVAQPGEIVLDVVLVEPSYWFFGIHRATDWHSRWPGGVQPIEPKYPPISRAYYKAAEAIAWSGFEMQPGEVVVEIGSAPGGACGRLLEMGMQVIGIDPAEMDPRIARHSNFTHLRARAGDLPRSEFREAKWLLVDSNVRPDKTLTTIHNIVTHRHSQIRGALITLKIGDYENVAWIDQWTQRMNQWEPRSIQAKQLARNKREICFAVEF